MILSPHRAGGLVYQYRDFLGGWWVNMWDEANDDVVLSPVFWGRGVHLRRFTRQQFNSWFKDMDLSQVKHWDPAVQGRFDREVFRRQRWIDLHEVWV